MNQLPLEVHPLFPKEPPLGYEKVTLPALLTSSARQAWEIILKSYALQGVGDVLLPAYIGYTDREGSGVFDPVRNAGLGYRFYAVDDQLAISVEDLKEQLERGGVGVLLIVHWFGFPHVNLDEIRAVCDTFSILLVEDCAHVLGPLVGDRVLGCYGDAAFYSFHKTFGGDRGGILVWNNQDSMHLSMAENFSFSSDLLTKIFMTDFRAVAKHRRDLYELFVQGLNDIEGVQVMYPDVGPYIPHSCPVKVLNGNREKLYFALAAKGVVLTSLYYRLIHEIDPVLYPAGHAVAKAILNFPVHQAVPREIVPNVIEMVRTSLKEL